MRRGTVLATLVLSVVTSLAWAQPVVSFTGFATPESVLFDQAADAYLVSNINGNGLDADDNGFISKLSPEGEVLDLMWIDGAAEDVELNAPKGLAISGDTLYVADIDTVRMFDRESGEPMGEVRIEGASFLNDMASGPDGSVYVTDSGLDPSFAPNGTDAIYRITADGQLETVIQGAELANPNGLAVLEDGALFVVTFSPGGKVYAVQGGEQQDVMMLPAEQLDGVVVLPGGDKLISSWSASSVLRLSPDGQTTTAVEGVAAPADIGYDSQRNRLLVPLFMDNSVEVYELPGE